ncbi:hypothetical protein QBL02_02525 [Leucobacter sp. UT-8R-CII-1-4]|uniref:hypothetical protein n=1 Tax=Leucobacter sp. UT-8R-CII-1-4 TaxID=3040075 RepID=UPI0024A9AF36|nr:hypothetical protein [Leucobacter sp. UT-8R-CII-1-4]MDI6022414.1 hypothetical protein [Leucobacter sp. UT-8R-CII-1-4]
MIFDRVLSPEESVLVLPELQALQRTSPFHARVIVQSTSGIEQSHVEVDRANGEWFAIDESGYVDEFRDATAFHGGEPVEHETTMFSERPSSLDPFFPEGLLW